MGGERKICVVASSPIYDYWVAIAMEFQFVPRKNYSWKLFGLMLRVEISKELGSFDNEVLCIKSTV